MKLTIEYDPNAGHVCKDGEAEEWVDKIVEGAKKYPDKNDLVVTVASALIIDFFRLRLAEGVIKEDQIEFVFDGKTLEHNKYGRITHWPKGFCDIPIDPMEKILTIQADHFKKRLKTELKGKIKYAK